ncbi:MAG: KilA-N domain-containing protein [Betaproteobacteria bacterium]|nr:KilA-N domain-containing protein [Betaproteobacteria bacterium]
MNALALITVDKTAIRQSDGLYSLNDLHRASGGEPKNRPSLFLSNAQTQALAEEISNAGIPAFQVQRGAGGGTYACRELVIAYAAWISPAFHLKVLRVFLDQLAAPRKVSRIGKGLSGAITEAVRTAISDNCPVLLPPAVVLTEAEAVNLYGLLTMIPYFNERLEIIEQGLRILGSSFAPLFFDARNEPMFRCCALKALRDRCEPYYRKIEALTKGV